MTPGSMNYSREIAHVMSKAIKDCPHDRIEIAARMSRLLGEEVTVSMLDTWTAGSKEGHIPNFERAIAFDAATESYALSEFHAGKLGCRVLQGKENLHAELGRMEDMRDQLAQQIKTVRAHLKVSN